MPLFCCCLLGALGRRRMGSTRVLDRQGAQLMQTRGRFSSACHPRKVVAVDCAPHLDKHKLFSPLRSATACHPNVVACHGALSLILARRRSGASALWPSLAHRLPPMLHCTILHHVGSGRPLPEEPRVPSMPQQKCNIRASNVVK